MTINEAEKKRRQEKIRQSDEAIDQLNDMSKLYQRIKQNKAENDQLREEESKNNDVPLKKIASTETNP